MLDPKTRTLLPRAREQIVGRYVEAVAKALKEFHFHISAAEISRRELGLAMDEADLDFKALLSRRSQSHGISEGKIAGVIAYRFSRFKILHFKPDALDQKHVYLIQDAAALFLVSSIILHRKIGGRRLLEICYQMARRHANQETMGVIFDGLMNEAA
ncbi:MAG: hypothetical protein HQL41_08655 [Alphaproteobacteria bacterium]|nr:hypothetical protein [Alphaproteobacteria bacterium]